MNPKTILTLVAVSFMICFQFQMANSEEVTLAEFKKSIECPKPNTTDWLNNHKMETIKNHSQNYMRALDIDIWDVADIQENDVQIMVFIDGWKFVLYTKPCKYYFDDESLVLMARYIPKTISRGVILMKNPPINYSYSGFTFLSLYWHERLLKELVK